MKKKNSKWWWVLWTPLLIIGLVIALLAGTFVVGIYSVEYEKDEYEVSTVDYEGLEMFGVTYDYSIVTDDSLLLIADKFNTYVRQIYGSEFPVVHDATDKYIKLAVDEMLDCDYQFKSSDNKNIVITGNNVDHVLRGVYAFLEEFGGIKCYTKDMIYATADAIVYPSKDGGYTQKYSDYFEMRDTDFLSPKDDEYSWFRGFNTDEYRYNDAEKEGLYDTLGGRVQYISGFCHTFASEFVSHDKYYDNGLELECYALDSNGNRRRDELCLSNPRTVEIVTQEVFAILESDRYDPNAPLQIISLTQADDLTGCKCDACVSAAKAHGGYSYPNLVFVNQVAKAVKDAGYDNVAIDTFAYRYTRKCPTDIVPEDNVIIRLCSIEACTSHYMDDEKCKTNVSFMNDLADWGNICDRIYIWDYCTDFCHYMSVYPNIEVLAHNLRVFYENGVKGVYEEGAYSTNKDGSDIEFAELRAYVISKVLQDPYCDVQAVMKDFCDAYYGEAGDLMLKFVKLTDKYAGRRHNNIYKTPEWILPCTKAELAELNDLFEQAKAVATGDALEHVMASECCWRYYKMYKHIYEFANKDTWQAEKDKLYSDITGYGQTRFHEIAEHVKKNNLQQTAIVDLHLLFDFIVGKFLYGP